MSVFSVTLEDGASGMVVTTELTGAPCVSDVLGQRRRHGRPSVRLVRDTAYRAVEESLLGPVPGLEVTAVEVGRTGFEVVLQNDVDLVLVSGDYGSREALVRHEVKPADPDRRPAGT